MGQAQYLFWIKFGALIVAVDRKIGRVNATSWAIENCRDNPVERSIFFLRTMHTVAPWSIGNRKSRDSSIVYGIKENAMVFFKNHFPPRWPEVKRRMSTKSPAIMESINLGIDRKHPAISSGFLYFGVRAYV